MDTDAHGSQLLSYFSDTMASNVPSSRHVARLWVRSAHAAQDPRVHRGGVLSLALGIGANSAIFSLANGLIFRPMHVPNASQVIVVQSQMRGESLGGPAAILAGVVPGFCRSADRSQSFSGLVASEYLPLGFTVDKNALPRMKFSVAVSGDFFRVLGLTPAAGRDFRPEEDSVPGRDAVVMLGYDLWKSEFSGSPDAIGKTIFLNGLDFTVIGVAPESFTGPHPHDPRQPLRPHGHDSPPGR
jgi:hypothetical protein